MMDDSRIQQLVQDKLSGRRLDVPSFIEELLLLARTAGTVSCVLAEQGSLHLAIGSPSVEAPLDAAQWKLRMLCARLGVLCNESGVKPVSLHGGAGIIATKVFSAAATNGVTGGDEAAGWTVQFDNTPSRQGFKIASVASRDVLEHFAATISAGKGE